MSPKNASRNAHRFRETVAPVVQRLHRNGLSLRAIAAERNAHGIKTGRSKKGKPPPFSAC